MGWWTLSNTRPRRLRHVKEARPSEGKPCEDTAKHALASTHACICPRDMRTPLQSSRWALAGTDLESRSLSFSSPLAFHTPSQPQSSFSRRWTGNYRHSREEMIHGGSSRKEKAHRGNSTRDFILRQPQKHRLFPSSPDSSLVLIWIWETLRASFLELQWQREKKSENPTFKPVQTRLNKARKASQHAGKFKYIAGEEPG